MNIEEVSRKRYKEKGITKMYRIDFFVEDKPIFFYFIPYIDKFSEELNYEQAKALGEMYVISATEIMPLTARNNGFNYNIELIEL